MSRNSNGLTRGQQRWLQFIKLYGPVFIRETLTWNRFCSLTVKSCFKVNQLKVSKETLRVLKDLGFVEKTEFTHPYRGYSLKAVEKEV